MHPNVSFIKFADVKLPAMVELPGKGYVQFGEDNLYPNFLLEKINKSSKHNGIVLGKVNYIIGNGISYKSGRENITPNKNETLNDFLKKVSIDIEIFGGVYIELHYNALGQVGAMYHVPYQKVRANKDQTQYYIKDWTQSVRVQPEIVAAYNPAVKQGKQILCYKEYRPGLDIYSYPNYIGALNWIEIDIELSKYHLSTIKNGMFSSKLINFNEGKPSPEEQQVVETKFKKKFTGSENAGGIVLSFSDDPAKAPTVLDLSNTDLDKHFEILNKTVEQQIFVGHQVTSPVLFGIKTEGQLGGRTEIRDSFEIFKTTYVNDKQRSLETLFTEISKLWGIDDEMVIAPIEPIGFEFSEATIKEVAPKAWILEKIGIDLTKYPEAQAAVQPEAAPAQSEMQVNENLKNLTGRQWQGVNRIIRNFEKGKINKEQAKLLLKSSLGLSDDEISIMLSLDNEMEFSAQDHDELLLAEFAAHGESKDQFNVIASRARFDFQQELTQAEVNILDLIKKDKNITPEVIAKALKMPLDEVVDIIKSLTESGLIIEAVSTIIQDKPLRRPPGGVPTGIVGDKIIERKLPEPLSRLTDKEPRTLEQKIMYSYEGPRDNRNRDFCRRLLDMDKLYSRSDIETMSQRLGYSVWDRRGGWWTKPNGVASPSCRHRWVQNFVVRKK
jgi:DNA-binding Lrp family transcriptional regulator